MKRVMTAIACAGLCLAGCASSGPLKVADAAPVTYRVGDGVMSSASTSVVKRHSTEEFERRHSPAAPVETVLPDIETPEVLEFDLSRVDRELYVHQRVGKTYEVFGKHYTPKHQPSYDETGIASWYGPKFHGKPTAIGETFDMNGMSAAHKTLPLNSLVHVTNLSTGKSLILRVNDRGPFVDGRIIDLSKAAAIELGLMEDGLKRVRVRYAGPADPNDIKAPRIAPRRMAEAPSPTIPTAPQTEVAPEPQYTPLRELLDQVAEVIPQSVAEPFALPDIEPAQGFEPYRPSYEALPEVTPDVRDEPLTLTIKGPIHLASSERMRHPEHIVAASHD